MARMSDFHVVGDPRYAPDAPSGGGGVSKEYVDNADINVKKTAAKGHNNKYNESVLPSIFRNKLYVYGNPELMYKASETGGDEPIYAIGGSEVSYNWWGQEVETWDKADYKIYGEDTDSGNNYNRLAVVKCVNPENPASSYYVCICPDYKYTITANPQAANAAISVINSLSHEYGATPKTRLWRQAYSGDPLAPQGYVDIDYANQIAGVEIYDESTYNKYYNCRIAGIPLFNVTSNTQEAFNAVNTYIRTGDASGAINYADINPHSKNSYCAIDVISGDWYSIVNNAWVKQGTLELSVSDDMELSDLTDVNINNIQNGQILKYDSNSSKFVNADDDTGTEVEANPSGEPTATLTAIEIDGTVYSVEGGGGGETDLIPLMTSDTTPSGTVSYSSQYGSSYAGYMAFNGQQSSGVAGSWLANYTDNTPYLQYAWTSEKKLSKMYLEVINDGYAGQRTLAVQGYNGTSWENCLKNGNSITLNFPQGQHAEYEIELNGNNYSAIKISCNEALFVMNQFAGGISRMQVYSISGGISADGVSYDNTTSHLNADDVQEAIDELADEKANTSDLGTASTKDFTTSVTQGSNDLVTSGAVWTAIDNLPEPMIFKGTLGTNGTITSLPTASSTNEGWTYKVITAGTYAGQSARVGDLFTSNATEWVYIPSGDESDTDTWRGINVNGSQLLGNGISSGNVNFKSGTNAQVSGSGNDVTIDIDTTFTDASSRVNIASGDSIKTILGKIKKFFADLKTVAFTNSYNDLDNKPTIPTVNNATLNIKKNGTSQGTFTANASTDVNVDISVPTKTSDLTNDSGYITDAGVTGVKGNNESTYRTGQVNLTADNVGAVPSVMTTSSLAYEYNKFINVYGGTNTKICIGKFPCYDSNITIEISGTTSKGYYGVILVSTQNINDAHNGTVQLVCYADDTGDISNNVYLYYPPNSRYIEIYFDLGIYRKTFIHIRSGNMYATPTNICELISSIPSEATTKPIRLNPKALANFFQPFGGTGNRPSTANLSGDSSGGLKKFLATPSMSVGKPYSDGHIIHMDWDNTTRLSAQLFISNNINSAKRIQYRIQSTGSADDNYWNDWIDIVDEDTFDSYVTGSISSGDTKAITGGAVYDYHNTATVDLGNQVYLEKSGNVVNIEICGLYGNDIASKTIPVGYRPKRQLRIPARFVDSTNNETVGTFVININGKIAAQYQTAVPGAMTSLTTSIYKVYCNITYIV